MNHQRYNLDRGWKFSKSEFSVLPKVLNHNNVYGFAKAGGAVGVASPDFDDAKWGVVDLPHDWQHNEPFDMDASPNHGYRKGEIGWYRRKFQLQEEDKGKAIYLNFDGIAGVSTIYFNGSKVYRNESNYNSFSVELTDLANYGINPNVIAIEVDCRVWEGWWYEGSGIYRHVWLVKSQAVHTKNNGIWVQTQMLDNNLWNTKIETKIVNSFQEERDYCLETNILDADGEVIQSDKSGGSIAGYGEIEITQEMQIKSPVLWSPETPRLYTVESKVLSRDEQDIVHTDFGYRSILVDAEKGFFLNGENIKLLGTCNHQDHAGVGAAVPDAVQEYRLQILKDMGCNAYRCAHHNPSPELLNMCDRMGILVMDENRAFNTSKTGIELVKSMVERDRNHPSVVMYSVFNEEPLQGTGKGRKLAARLTAEIKKMDQTRPVLGAFNGGYMEKEGAATVFDITGINYFTDSYDEFHRQNPNQPVISSELVSAFSTRDNYENNGEKQIFDNYDHNIAPWGETVRDANKAVFEREFVMGMFVWTGFDYRGEPSPYEWPSVSSHFGTIDLCGFPKDTYYLYQAYWKKEPVLHLLPHWNHKKGEIIKVMAYGNCDEVELFLNKNSFGRKICNKYEQVEWEILYESGILLAVGYRDGIEVIRDSRETTKPAVDLKLQTDKTLLYRDTKDAVVLNVSAVDEDGRFVPTENSMVRFEIIGGRILGTGNGNPNSHEMDSSLQRYLFNGRCQAIIVAGSLASVKVKVTSDVLNYAEIEWEVQERSTEEEILPAENVIISGWRMSHVAQMEKPDPGVKMGATDMNTFEPVNFERATQPQFDNKKLSYCMYRTFFNLGSKGGVRSLVISKISGKIEVYINEKKIGEKNCPMPQRADFCIPGFYHGECEIVIIIQNTAIDARAGILEPVELLNHTD